MGGLLASLPDNALARRYGNIPMIKQAITPLTRLKKW